MRHYGTRHIGVAQDKAGACAQAGRSAAMAMASRGGVVAMGMACATTPARAGGSLGGSGGAGPELRSGGHGTQ